MMLTPLSALKRSCDHGGVVVMLAPGQVCPLCALKAARRPGTNGCFLVSASRRATMANGFCAGHDCTGLHGPEDHPSCPCRCELCGDLRVKEANQ